MRGCVCERSWWVGAVGVGQWERLWRWQCRGQEEGQVSTVEFKGCGSSVRFFSVFFLSVLFAKGRAARCPHSRPFFQQDPQQQPAWQAGEQGGAKGPGACTTTCLLGTTTCEPQGSRLQLPLLFLVFPLRCITGLALAPSACLLLTPPAVAAVVAAVVVDAHQHKHTNKQKHR
jgi:hypothetical protein